MKRLMIIIVGIALLSACSNHRRKQMVDVYPDQHSVIGTWEHTFEGAPQNVQIKVLNRTHYIWVTYERATGMPLLMGGGTYRCDGHDYVETVMFGSPGIQQELIGKDQVFTATFKGDLWYHQGILSNGMPIKELWRRID
jgi:hypothetical protein